MVWGLTSARTKAALTSTRLRGNPHKTVKRHKRLRKVLLERLPRDPWREIEFFCVWMIRIEDGEIGACGLANMIDDALKNVVDLKLPSQQLARPADLVEIRKEANVA